ncbi:Nn.00g051970.m01.CDS01 [Neocucurbitaria sp. VM-36]
MPHIDGFEVTPVPEQDEERQAVSSRYQGFHIRHPPKPHLLSEEITKDEELFQTIHMGSVVVDVGKWLLVVDGLVERPFALTFKQLLALPHVTITSIVECFGSPLAPPITALWRIGNVTWTGVPLCTLLSYARPLPSAQFVWSEGLDSGVFAGVEAERYQKDLPLDKALSKEVLIAYEMNGQPLGRERGGPVRLVVPGWFGTNSTKWLCKLSLREERAPGPYTTRFYNIKDQDDPKGRMIPVWKVDVNSMIVRPAPDTVMRGFETEVEGWAWSHGGVAQVDISSDDGQPQ